MLAAPLVLCDATPRLAATRRQTVSQRPVFAAMHDEPPLTLALYNTPPLTLVVVAHAARKALPKKRGREGVMDAESMGLPGRSTNAGAEPMRALADAGMVLRDPSTLYLIIHHVRPM